MNNPSANPSRPPVVSPEDPLEWIRNNLFSNWFSSGLTILLGFGLLRLGQAFWYWASNLARWDILPANLPLYFAGRFPQTEYWRLWLILSIVSLLSGFTLRGLSKTPQMPLQPPALVGLGLATIVTLIPTFHVDTQAFPYADWQSRIVLTLRLALVLFGLCLGRNGLCTLLKRWGTWTLPALWILGLALPLILRWDPWAISWGVSTLLGLTWIWLQPRLPNSLGGSTLLALLLGSVVLVIPPIPLAYRGALVGELALLLLGIALRGWGDRLFPKLSQGIGLIWFLAFFPVLWLLRGGLGLPIVSTNDWSGILLTVFMSLVSIALCFPLGVLLALGRQSDLFALRWISTLHIEIIRGVPLISILFMGQVMIPLFLPEGIRPDRVLRAIIGLTLFSAVYMAENIRGGLQAIPKGQLEAAHALGLNSPLTVTLIVLPQALKVSIPAIIGQFISLFQDTTLLSIVGLLELLGLSRAVLANPQFVGRNAETYLFIAVLYWGVCYAMSLAGRRLERELSRDHH